MHDREAVLKTFEEAEAIFRLSGLNPDKNVAYQELKRRRIEGEISADSMGEALYQHFKNRVIPLGCTRP